MEIPVLCVPRTVGTHVESMSRERENRYKRGRSKDSKSSLTIRRRDVDRTKVGKHVSHVPRKAAIVIQYPYRKPTQVDEERILRPTEEALLRNSAK